MFIFLIVYYYLKLNCIFIIKNLEILNSNFNYSMIELFHFSKLFNFYINYFVYNFNTYNFVKNLLYKKKKPLRNKLL